MSTNSFALNMHFCGEHLMDVAFTQSAEVCAMHDPESTEQPDNCDITKEDCCKNVQKIIKGQDELSQAQKTEIAPLQVNFLSAYFLSYAQLFQASERVKANFNFYVPPLLVRDIQQRDEVYLI